METKKQKTKTASENMGSDWIDIFKKVVVDNVKNFTLMAVGEIRDNVTTYVKKLTCEISRAFFSSVVISMGLVFLMAGLAILINEVIGISKSIGYIFVGIIVVLVGILFQDNSVNCKKK